MEALNVNHPIWHSMRKTLLWAPFRMLERDHESLLNDIEQLRRTFRRWSGQDPAVWEMEDKRWVKDWLRRHRVHLRSHFHAEETVLFPYLLQHIPRLRSAVAKLQEEHQAIRGKSHAVEAAFKALTMRSRQLNADQFCDAALAMLCLIEHHVRQESRLMEIV